MKPIVVSFDFDDTLASKIVEDGERKFYPIPQFVDLLREYHAFGCRCIILTARSPNAFNYKEIVSFLKSNDVHHCISDYVFTSHVPKGLAALKHGVRLHYDDMEGHLESVREYGIKAISSKFSD